MIAFCDICEEECATTRKEPCDLSNSNIPTYQRHQSQIKNNETCKTSRINWGKEEELSHGFMVKQACTITVDSVTRLITEVISSLEDVHILYRELISVFVELLEESRVAAECRQDLITCKMVVVRSRLEEARQKMMELETYLCTVERLSHITAEASFIGHAEYPSIALSERLQSALLQAKIMRETTADLERDMLSLQSIIIVESGKSLK